MKRYKARAGYVVLVATLAMFVWYVRSHPEVVRQLQSTKFITVLQVLGLYGGMTLVLAVLYRLMLDLCKVAIPPKENILLTMYSSVVNFFGPLQSGPGFRMVYLKKRFNVSMKAYAASNILYYIIFAAVSGAFLLCGVLGWWALIVLILGLLLLWYGAPQAMRLTKIARFVPDTSQSRTIALLAAVTLIQLLLVASIYFVELRSLNPSVTFNQALIYAGAANFSLFVSLTPGALGFRESFLFFSQRLHHIDSATIVSANILDRALYVVFLGILFVIILLLHGKKQLDASKPAK